MQYREKPSDIYYVSKWDTVLDWTLGALKGWVNLLRDVLLFTLALAGFFGAVYGVGWAVVKITELPLCLSPLVGLGVLYAMIYGVDFTYEMGKREVERKAKERNG